MLPFLNQILNDGITPNGLYFLMSISDGKYSSMIDFNLEKKKLIEQGYIVDNKISIKGLDVIEKYKKIYKKYFSKKSKEKYSFTAQEEEYIHQYREIFPKGVLPSGYPARLAFKELEKRFTWFFSNYTYDWSIILKATKMYVEKYKHDNYMYMKTSGYFIIKNENGVEVSTLATYCDMVKDEVNQEPDTQTDLNNYSSAI